ncbi:hypothetical protein EIY87_02595 [Amycolatopsis eburnea]|uniref:Uncharacterized protein n=1 Tax=Amycolatopsis eburnea TaxID=2267691 RepID=A0A427TLS6_9PSEU|nr:hypothetical protein EIY87_02595 [Amycolatopsis eburnea]
MALVASDAPKAAFGASDAPKATLGRLSRARVSGASGPSSAARGPRTRPRRTPCGPSPSSATPA